MFSLFRIYVLAAAALDFDVDLLALNCTCGLTVHM